MSIYVCLECDVVVEGHTIRIDGFDCCPYCDDPATSLPEDPPEEDYE